MLKVEQAIQQMQEATGCTDNFIWKIPGVQTEETEGKTMSLYPAPFYAGHRDYKLCLCLYMECDGSGKGTLLSFLPSCEGVRCTAKMAHQVVSHADAAGSRQRGHCAIFLNLQMLQATTYTSTFIWKIPEVHLKRHEARIGKTIFYSALLSTLGCIWTVIGVGRAPSSPSHHHVGSMMHS